MDQLIQEVSLRAGISPNQAREAIQAIDDFLKDRLPMPISSLIDQYLGGPTAPGQGGLRGQPADIYGGDQPPIPWRQ